MASISIRDLDDDVKQRLRVRAAQQGRSMEAEARAILADAVRTGGPTPGLFTALAGRRGDHRDGRVHRVQDCCRRGDP